MNRVHILLLAALGLLLFCLPACPTSGGGGDDDDTTAADDDDDTTAADDDDTTAADDDDTTPPGDTFTDCDGVQWDNEDCVDFWGIPCLDGVGDGYCDDGSDSGAPNFNCSQFNFDEGDCGGGDDDDSGDDDDDDDDDTSGCPSGEIVDCDGGCVPAGWVGDNYCDESLNCAAHSFDGGDCANQCTQHTQCNNDEFCYQTSCELIFGRSFNISFDFAIADQFDANGNNWDLLDAPDMYGQLTLDGTVILTTATEPDSLSAYWYEDVDVILTPTSLCRITYDEDVGPDDLMDSACRNSADGIVDLVRAQWWTGDMIGGQVSSSHYIYPNF